MTCYTCQIEEGTARPDLLDYPVLCETCNAYLLTIPTLDNKHYISARELRDDIEFAYSGNKTKIRNWKDANILLIERMKP
jgi:hypothetical protein